MEQQPTYGHVSEVGGAMAPASLTHLPPPPIPISSPPPPPLGYTVVLPVKSVGIAYLLLFLFGLWGGHHFYLGRIGKGMLYAFTFGFLGFGVIYDLFALSGQVAKVNMEIRAGTRAG